MARALDFLLPGEAPETETLATGWQKAGEESRKLYGERHSSGAQTRADPLNVSFHQRHLSPDRAAQVWAHLDRVLSPGSLALLERYRRA
jgi:hypothetical protein